MAKPPYLKPPSKEELRQHLSRDIETFLAQGGSINQVEPGETGLASNQRPLHAPLFNDPPAERTPLYQVIATLDERRAHMKRPTSAQRKTQRKPRKKVIYDDFGEPLRTVWEDE